MGEDGTTGWIGGYVAAGYGWIWFPSGMVAVILLLYLFLGQ